MSSDVPHQWQGKEGRNWYILNFCAIDVNATQIGTSFGMSSTFPSSGNPFGPGGNGNLAPLRFRFQINARLEAAMHKNATKKTLSFMSRDNIVGGGVDDRRGIVPFCECSWEMKSICVGFICNTVMGNLREK